VRAQAGPGRRGRPGPPGVVLVSRPAAQTRAQKQLELVAHALGWTSAERARQLAALAHAFARGATAAARDAFLDRLAGWTTAALERSPGPVESARLAALAQVSALVREAPTAAEALHKSLGVLQGAIRFESATCFLFD